MVRLIDRIMADGTAQKRPPPVLASRAASRREGPGSSPCPWLDGFELIEPLLDVVQFRRPREPVHELRELSSLRGRQLASRDRLDEGGRRLHGISGCLQGREGERDVPILAGRQKPVQAQAQGRHIAALGEVNRRSRQRLALPLEQRLQGKRRHVPSPSWPSRVAALEGLPPRKSHVFSRLVRASATATVSRAAAMLKLAPEDYREPPRGEEPQLVIPSRRRAS